MSNQKGFTLIEVLLGLIVLTLMGGVGYYVYDSQKDNSKSPAQSPQSSTAQDLPAKVENDPTVGWKTYTGKDFTLKHPSDWLDMKNSQNCPEYFGRGATEGSQGICQSDAGAQVSVISSVEPPATFVPGADYYTDIVKTTVQINGIAAERYGSVSKGTEFHGFEDKGTKWVHYIFAKNGKTFLATYNDGNGKYKDVLKDFDTIMTKTFKFNQ